MSIEEERTSEEQDLESWLTADEAQEALGIGSHSALSKAAQAGRVKRARDRDGRWRYDPTSVDGRDDSPAPPPLAAVNTPAAESVLHGGATVVQKSGDFVVKLVDRLLQSNEQVVRMHEAMAGSMIGIVERLDKRCTTLEQLQVDFIKAREEFLSESASRALEARESESSMAMKEAVMAKLLENAEPLLELAAALTAKKSE